MNHQTVADKAIELLTDLPGVSALVLYGSVADGSHRADSDIDLAVILLNEMRAANCDMEGIPFDTREKVRIAVDGLERTYGIRVHVPIYFESQYKKGIELFSGRKTPPDLLHVVGKEFSVA
ncbi:nucleotidyltransferase domain-containing protein [Candidatus Woesearchaeota archaeon]|nr:nucleotidyltransferase domain-containing protein [Candidatus Woesearchaeota archaeon]